MIMFECMINVNGTNMRVRIGADRDQLAYQMLCAQYGNAAVIGWPHPV